MTNLTVFILGAHGETGSHILEGLLSSGKFNLIAGVRPPSLSKPKVQGMKARGVEIRAIDLEKWSLDQAAEVLKGVDVVISTIIELRQQKALADAALKAGVKRFIPSDFGPACVRGVRESFDIKLDVEDYVKQIGLGYTFVDIGWWMQLTIPYVDASKAHMTVDLEFAKFVYEADVKNAVTDVRDVGKFIARIIADERTLNKYVFCWAEEVTQKEALAIAERISGRKFDLPRLSAEEVARRAREAQDFLSRAVWEYIYSIWVRGDNRVENAKKEEYGGALDARALYPDVGKELRMLEDFAKDFYLG